MHEEHKDINWTTALFRGRHLTDSGVVRATSLLDLRGRHAEMFNEKCSSVLLWECPSVGMPLFGSALLCHIST